MLTVREFAEYWNITPSLVYRLANSGDIAAYKIGNVWRIDPEESMRLIREQTELEAYTDALGSTHTR